jgi:hypothetical protein
VVAAAVAAILMALLWLGAFLFFLYKSKQSKHPKEHAMEEARKKKEAKKSRLGPEAAPAPQVAEKEGNLFELQIPKSPQTGQYTKPAPIKQVVLLSSLRKTKI